MGLVWSLILHYQLGIGGDDPDPKRPTRASSPKKLLLEWVKANLPDMKVTNFTTDWNDGRTLSALVDSMKPGLIPNYATLDPANCLENTRRAMELAKENFGIPQVFF